MANDVGQGDDRYVAVPLQAVTEARDRGFGLYLRREEGSYVLLCGSGELLTADHVHTLGTNKVNVIYVRENDRGALSSLFSRKLPTLLKTPGLTPQQKAELGHACALDAVKRVLDDPRAEVIGECGQVVGAVAMAVLAEPALTKALVAMSRHGSTLYTHSMNVGIFATALASRRCGGDRELLQRLAPAYFLHDVGMCSIPPQVLQKRGAFNDKERELVERHPEQGLAILIQEGCVTPELSWVVLQHHERADGSGYPAGLVGDAISPHASICAIADAFDSLTSDRPHRLRRTTFAALKTIRDEMVRLFEPGLFEEFVELFVPDSMRQEAATASTGEAPPDDDPA